MRTGLVTRFYDFVGARQILNGAQVKLFHFPHSCKFLVQNGAAAVKGAPSARAKRSLDGEARSERIAEQGKWAADVSLGAGQIC